MNVLLSVLYVCLIVCPSFCLFFVWLVCFASMDSLPCYPHGLLIRWHFKTPCALNNLQYWPCVFFIHVSKFVLFFLECRNGCQPLLSYLYYNWKYIFFLHWKYITIKNLKHIISNPRKDTLRMIGYLDWNVVVFLCISNRNGQIS